MATEFISNSWLMPTNANAESNRVSNYSLDFDGTSQFIQIPNSETINITGALTYSFWFKTTSTSVMYPITFGSSGIYKFYAVLYEPSDLIRVRFVDGSGTFTGNIDNTNTSFYDGNWHQLTVTTDATTATDGIKIYFDGSLMATKGTLSNNGLNSITEDLFIGQIPNTSRFNGNLTEVSIFDYSLSASQVTELYGTGSAIGNPMAITNGRKPVAYYPLSNSAFNGEFLVPNGAEQDFVFDFDGGINNGININNDSSLQPSTSFTLSCWIKSETSQNFYAYPVYKESLDSSHVAYGFYLQGSSTIATTVTTSGVITSDNIGDLRDGKWHHVVQTYDGSGMKVYLDGVQSGTTKSITGNVVYSATSTELYIGNTRRTSPSGYFSFKGNISNVSVFNTALPATGTESVESLYNYGTPPNIASYSGLQAWYELDASATFDGSNWSIPDASSNSNTGTSSGMTAANLVQSDLIINAPYDSFSLAFDGLSEYIQLNTSSISFANSFSISMWIKPDSVSGFQMLFGGSGYSGGDGIGHYIYNNTIWTYVSIGGSATSIFQSSALLNIGDWTHIIIQRSANVKWEMWVDGVLNQSNSSDILTDDLTSANSRIARHYTNGTLNFDGCISNTSIYSSSLTAAQVTTLYNEGKPFDLNTFAVTPASWWRLGAVNTFYNSTTTEFTVLDEVGTNDGTSVNMEQGDLVDGVGATGSGTSSGMSSGTNRTGDAPYSENNAVSYNLSVTAKSTSTPT